MDYKRWANITHGKTSTRFSIVLHAYKWPYSCTVCLCTIFFLMIRQLIMSICICFLILPQIDKLHDKRTWPYTHPDHPMIRLKTTSARNVGYPLDCQLPCVLRCLTLLTLAAVKAVEVPYWNDCHYEWRMIEYPYGSLVNQSPVCLSISVKHTHTYTHTHSDTQTHTHSSSSFTDILGH